MFTAPSPRPNPKNIPKIKSITSDAIKNSFIMCATKAIKKHPNMIFALNLILYSHMYSSLKLSVYNVVAVGSPRSICQKIPFLTTSQPLNL